MRRVGRYAWDLLTLGSALLFLTAGALWLRSVGHVEVWRWNSWRADRTAAPGSPTDGTAFTRGVVSERGHLVVAAFAASPRPESGAEIVHTYEATGDPAARERELDAYFVSSFPPRARVTRWRVLGVGFCRIRLTGTAGTAPAVEDRLVLVAPYWALALVTGLAPASRLAGALRRRRRQRRGLCPTCGYDLRATPDAGGPLLERCPECGRAST